MFGYIQPDNPYLFVKDETLYKAMYCGLCVGIKKSCGNLARFGLSYEVSFLSILAHNLMHRDVKIERRTCIAHPFTKREMAACDDLFLQLGCVNTMLAYQKLCDDVRDHDRRGALKPLLHGAYMRAKRQYPAIAAVIEELSKQQAEVEQKNTAIIDEACEPSAQMLKNLSREVLGGYANADTDALFYAVGKWIYLVDALDDYDKDVKKGRFNVLYNAYGCPQKCQAVAQNEGELKFIFNDLFAQMRQSLFRLSFGFNHDLIDNVILRGIPQTSRRLFRGENSCKNEEKNHEQE